MFRTPRMKHRIDILIIGVSACIAIGAFGAWWLGTDDGDVGDVGAIEQRLSAPERPAEVAATAPIPTGVRDVALPDAPPPGLPSADDLSDGDGDTQEPLLRGRFTELPAPDVPLIVPVGLSIDRLEVAAPVVAAGVDLDTLEMAVPDNVTDVAWYEFGALPGEAGSAVLAAHVDLSSQGPGVFFDLETLEPGDRVTVDFSDGTSEAFVVEARATYDKEELPLDAIFAREGDPVLTLITCGGGFNRSIGSYDSNVVVYAVPVDGIDRPIG